jgi:hypothetical protein
VFFNQDKTESIPAPMSLSVCQFVKCQQGKARKRKREKEKRRGKEKRKGKEKREKESSLSPSPSLSLSTVQGINIINITRRYLSNTSWILIIIKDIIIFLKIYIYILF